VVPEEVLLSRAIQTSLTEKQLSYPFFIWTFQRTGGTSLSNILSSALGQGGLKHEPFNLDREYGFITTLFNGKEYSEGRLRLDEVLDTEPCVKHCFELRSKPLNTALLNSLANRPRYRHIILMRKNEADRICSLFLARQTAVWSKGKAEQGGYDDILQGETKLRPFPIEQMLEHSQFCFDYRKWLQSQFAEIGIDAKQVYFEDLYAGSADERLSKIWDLARFIGATELKNQQSVKDRLCRGGQKSNRLFAFIPNFEEAWETLNNQITLQAQLE